MNEKDAAWFGENHTVDEVFIKLAHFMYSRFSLPFLLLALTFDQVPGSKHLGQLTAIISILVN